MPNMVKPLSVMKPIEHAHSQRSNQRHTDAADCGPLSDDLFTLGQSLDRFFTFEHADAVQSKPAWTQALGHRVPSEGVGLQQLIEELNSWVIPNGSAVPKPGCSAFITTGATNAGILSTLAGIAASPQRIGITAFNHLEALALDWLADLLKLPAGMQGVFCSGGSTANLVALGAARQHAFLRRATDVAKQGISSVKTRVYVSADCHRVVHRSAAVLGLGMDSVLNIDCDAYGRINTAALTAQIEKDVVQGVLPVAIVANAGTTSTGAIDPIARLADIAEHFDIWLHVDGAYGLPGILDPRVEHLYQGIERADSFVVDPHKWLGAPVGIGAVYVKQLDMLYNSFRQGHADYLEGSCDDGDIQHSMDSLGVPYTDLAIELSAPCRGVVVWALLREIGIDGLRQRIIRHNSMARHIADQAKQHPDLELLLEPTLSICCFRYHHEDVADLNALNAAIHRQLVRNGNNIPSTTVIDGKLAIRPCFIGARTLPKHADALLNEVLSIGEQMVSQFSTLN